MDPLINQTAWTVLVVLSAFVIIGSLMLVWKYAAPPEIPQTMGRRQAQNTVNDQAEVVPGQNRDGIGRMRRRRRAQESESEDEIENPVQENPTLGTEEKSTSEPAVLGKKKLRKLQEKEEKARMREAMEEAKKARNEREDREIYERKKKQQEEEEKERLEEEELEKARQERVKKEEEEYNSLKHMFSVEGGGSLLDDQTKFEQDEEGFIQYIKQIKVVYLEDLASKYHVKTQSIVDRINALETEGKINGIIDERGKFIFLTQDELLAVSKFIKGRGRVHISEIQRESNNLVDLNPADVPYDETLLADETPEQTKAV